MARARKKDNKFMIGDYVQATGCERSGATYHVVGLCGYVVGYSLGGSRCAVEFERNFGGHDCDGMAKRGCGQWMAECDLELIETKPDIEVDVTNLI